MNHLTFTPDEVEALLVRQGVPRDHAHRTAFAKREDRSITITQAMQHPVAAQRPVVLLPVSFRVPWSDLVADNRKHGVIRGHILNTRAYRLAKRHVHERALTAAFGSGPAVAHGEQPEPVTCAVSISVGVIPPDHRRHDMLNFAKLLCDACEGAIYRDDSQIVRAVFSRSPVDVDAPGCTVEVEQKCVTFPGTMPK